MPMATKLLQREYSRKWIAKRRAEYFRDKSCSKCCSKDRLEIHHVFRETKVSHSVWSWSKDRREIELAKCVVLCWECHQEETRKERYRPIRHGTATGYRRGCRCNECRIGRAESDRRYKSQMRLES